MEGLQKISMLTSGTKLSVVWKIYLVIMFVLFPFIITAQSQTYQPLAPLPGTTVGNCDPSNPNSPECKVGIEKYLPGMFQLLIGIAGVIVVIQIVIGGVQYLSTDAISGKSEGRSRIENALVGLLLVIGCFIILNTINPRTLELNLEIQRYNPPALTEPQNTAGQNLTPVGCPVNRCSPTPGFTCSMTPYVSPTEGCTPVYTPTTPGQRIPCRGSACLAQYPEGSAWPDDSAVRAQLTPAFTIVGSQSSTCATVGQRGCTSVYDLGQQAINGLRSLATNCTNCSLIITGGSEFWLHSSHGPGTNRVDLSYTPGDRLDQHIRTTGTPLTNNGCFRGQPAWQVGSAVYVLENRNHWHVCYSPSIF